MRKDYRRQLIAAAVALLLALLVLLYVGLDGWLFALIVLGVAYSAAYQWVLQFDATAKVADSDRL